MRRPPRDGCGGPAPHARELRGSVLALKARGDRSAATIVVVTFVVLVLELTSTRLYGYIGSTHATSVALSIALLGTSVGALVRVRWHGWPGVGRTAPWLSAALLAVALAEVGGVALPWLVLVSLPPFALAGLFVVDANAARGRDGVRATYALDLGAAADGCLIAPRLVGPLAPTEIVAALGVLGGAWALRVVEPRPRLDGAYVYRVVAREGGQSVELARIRAGQRASGMAEVLEGLSAGDQVITEGVQSLRPGQPVQLAPPQPAAEGALPLRPRGR